MSINSEFMFLFSSEALRNTDILSLRESLIQFRDKGMGKSSMIKNMEELRSVCQSEADEDVLMELMDFVVGFCSPHLSIF